jgi:hypothetical protein
MTNQLLWPCDMSKAVVYSTFLDHKNRAGYIGSLANDLASYGQVKLPLWASQNAGKVLRAGWDTTGYGNETFIEYACGLRVQNAHMDSIAVAVGQAVNARDPIGIMGATGNATGVHTHFAVWEKRDGKWINIDPIEERTIVDQLGAVVVPPVTPVIPPVPPTLVELPYFPSLPIAFPLYDDIAVRKQPNKSAPFLFILPEIRHQIIETISDGSGNLWARLGYNQYFAVYYGGRWFVKWEAAK